MAEGINPLLSAGKLGGIGAITPSEGSSPTGEVASGFGSMLSGALQEVSALEVAADDEARKVATGQSADLTEAVVASEKAKLAMDFTIEVRNKIVDAYQDLWRMPI